MMIIAHTCLTLPSAWIVKSLLFIHSSLPSPEDALQMFVELNHPVLLSTFCLWKSAKCSRHERGAWDAWLALSLGAEITPGLILPLVLQVQLDYMTNRFMPWTEANTSQQGQVLLIGQRSPTTCHLRWVSVGRWLQKYKPGLASHTCNCFCSFPFALCMFGGLTSVVILRNPKMEKHTSYFETFAFPEVKWHGAF